MRINIEGLASALPETLLDRRALSEVLEHSFVCLVIGWPVVKVDLGQVVGISVAPWDESPRCWEMVSILDSDLLFALALMAMRGS